MFPTCLEGALKLKELSYINANGYAAGELKHGPIALISPQTPTVALCANSATADKLYANMMEVKARRGPLLAIAPRESSAIEEVADEVLWVPTTLDSLAPITTSVVLQLLAYFIACVRGVDVDHPRNLAKSVTVE